MICAAESNKLLEKHDALIMATSASTITNMHKDSTVVIAGYKSFIDNAQAWH